MRRPTIAAALLGLATGIAALAAPAAHAAAITRIYDFSFTSFSPGGIAPVDPVTGTIKVTFDPAINTPATAPEYFSINLPAAYLPVTFIYGVFSQSLLVGNTCITSAACPITPGTNQFTFVVDAADPDAPEALIMFIASPDSPTTSAMSVSGTVTLHEGPDPSQVPEPATLALLGAGLLGLGAARRRRAI